MNINMGNVVFLKSDKKSSAKNKFVNIAVSSGYPKNSAELVYGRVETFFREVIYPVQSKGVQIKFPENSFSNEQIKLMEKCFSDAFGEYCRKLNDGLLTDRVMIELELHNISHITAVPLTLQQNQLVFIVR